MRTVMQKEMLPVCSECKKVRVHDVWLIDKKLCENLIKEFKENITHGICPECSKKLYPILSLDPPS